MSWKQHLEKVSEAHYVLPRTKTMRVHADLFLSDKLLWGEEGNPEAPPLEDAVFDQVVNAATFPGVTRVAVTPDCHVGYGVPIGTIVETDGTLLPTAAGYDIGCGMVQLQTSLTMEDVADPAKRRQWIDEVTDRIAVGVGATRARKQRRLSEPTLREVLRHGAKALGRSRSVTERDFIPVEDTGVSIPERAFDKRGQLGSLGGGNHFTEMQVDETGRVWVMLHTGSRGFGWNIAKHFFVAGAAQLGLKSHSEDFVWLDADSALGRSYWNLHNMAANFAVANRLLIGEAVCEALEDVFGGTANIYYEISHNLIQREGGRFVARKGATRAFPAGHPALKGTTWEATGHPILIPGSMETGSAILFAQAGAEQSIYSVNHGAGRRMSRAAARRQLQQEETDRRMAEAGILLNTRTTPLDESGPCYKNLDDVLETVEQAGLARVAHRLKPVACIKGAD
ncbi:RtcB family protein [Corallococcus interemptor]|uniref:RtcB family protein n=1 Tax=Corallococcus TaxID=83461 RepID=UPI001CC0A0AA|nr:MULTISPECIES: RtcB family protein [unclassified Corallococcus]MBZ4336280.1 RtcB family protein [Corallococcus sp. AS-1-12]MBZ4375593.1 RtcB family protein [Corallococcus sp. AS-1-6]